MVARLRDPLVLVPSLLFLVSATVAIGLALSRGHGASPQVRAQYSSLAGERQPQLTPLPALGIMFRLSCLPLINTGLNG